MAHNGFIDENEASRRELEELVRGLDPQSLQQPAGTGWTVSALLCHLAFWDQRLIRLLQIWQKEPFEPSSLNGHTVDSINHALQTIALKVPPEAATRLVLESAEAADAMVGALPGKLVEQLHAAGHDWALHRSLHRHEHIRQIREALNR